MIFPNKRPKILLLLWLTALAVAACGGSDGGGSSGFVEGASDFHTPTEAATEEAQEEPASENGAGVNFSLIAAPRRLVIMNADMQLVVSDPGQVMDQIAEMAEAYGGFVVESNLRTIQDQYNRPIPHATITVRVPANRLQQALEEVEASAEEILGKNLSGQDITSQYTDLKSRLRNLENTANQLAVIMEDAKNTDDTLKVYNKLTQVTNDIEVIKGKIQYYEKASAMSVITLVLNAVEMSPPKDPP